MPDTETHEDYYKDKPKFQAPRSYIRYKKLTDEEEMDFVFYDADKMDEAFVKAHINVNDAKRHQLNIERFEMLINALENFEAMRQEKGLKMTSTSDAEKLFREKFKFMQGPNAQKLRYFNLHVITLTLVDMNTHAHTHTHTHTVKI